MHPADAFALFHRSGVDVSTNEQSRVQAGLFVAGEKASSRSQSAWAELMAHITR
jgi:hypothetical protein